jgi:hypothetical protein
MAKASDLLSELGKQSAGALDRDLKSLADQQDKLLQAEKELRGYIEMAEKAEKPSAYPPELVKYLKKAGIKYGDKDSDQKKNIQLLEAAMENLRDQEQMLQFQLQTMIGDLNQMYQTMSTKLNQMNKDRESVVKNFK